MKSGIWTLCLCLLLLAPTLAAAQSNDSGRKSLSHASSTLGPQATSKEAMSGARAIVRGGMTSARALKCAFV